MDYAREADVRLLTGLINIISCFSLINQEKITIVFERKQSLEPLLLLVKVGFVFLGTL